jgi:hypothetical protein
MKWLKSWAKSYSVVAPAGAQLTKTTTPQLKSCATTAASRPARLGEASSRTPQNGTSYRELSLSTGSQPMRRFPPPWTARRLAGSDPATWHRRAPPKSTSPQVEGRCVALAGLRRSRSNSPALDLDAPPVASDGTLTGVYAGDKSAFSIHCYRIMLATDFAAYGLPSSLRKPRAAPPRRRPDVY